MLKNALAFNHQLLQDQVEKGDLVIDATLGNGKDALFLSNLVGKDGQLIGFDIQIQALEKTQERLKAGFCRAKTNLFLDGHENMASYCHNDSAKAIVFNLGYLPGSDKTLTTQARTTIEAVEAGLDILQPGGLMTLMVYAGHSEGQVEKEELEVYLQGLDQSNYTVFKYQPLNQKNTPPYLLAIEKLA